MSVQVELSLFGQLRTLVDAPKMKVEMDDEATVLDLFRHLVARFGDRFGSRVFCQTQGQGAWQRIQRHVLVFVNDVKIEPEDLPAAKLKTGEASTDVQVFVMQPFTGG